MSLSANCCAPKAHRCFGLTALQLFRMFPAGHVFHRLPVHYKKRLRDYHDKDPIPVHWAPDPRDFYKDPVTNQKVVVDTNVPIPIKYPPASHRGLWGGEGVIIGFKRGRRVRWAKDTDWNRRVPNLWTPVVKTSALYSEILDQTMYINVTNRALRLIDEAYGLDFYILKTDLIDLRSKLAFQLRRKMLMTLVDKDMYKDDPKRQEEVYEKYKQFIIPREEIEWVGLSLSQAIKKQQEIEKAAATRKKALKYKFREEIIAKMKDLEARGEFSRTEEEHESSWFQRLLPFTKKSKSTESQST